MMWGWLIAGLVGRRIAGAVEEAGNALDAQALRQRAAVDQLKASTRNLIHEAEKAGELTTAQRLELLRRLDKR
jgi:hypothetical protein